MPGPDPAAPGALWRIGRAAAISLERSRILAIINVTPDSFSDGGLHASPDAAAAYAHQAAAEGADALDIGGESTRPGAGPVDAAEQIGRVVPAIRAIRDARNTLPIFVDTTLARVAEAALDAGAQGVNDQSAGRDDPAMLALIASRGAGLILMHRPRPPRDDRYADRHSTPPDYPGGVVADVCAFLAERARAAIGAGVEPGAIALDPGLGFAKNVAQNLACLAGAPAFRALGFPVVCAASRKSFLGAVADEPDPRGRTHASVAAALVMRVGGASVFRVHDVRAHRQALAVADAALGARGEAARGPFGG